MTTRTASPGIPGRAVPLAIALASAAAVGSYLLISIASAVDSPVMALALVAGPALLIIALIRPDLAALTIPALVFSNAGLVMNENYGLPNVMRGVLVLSSALLVFRPFWRSRLFVITPVLWAGALFVVVRVMSAVQAPGVDAVKVFVNYAFGLGVVLVVAAITSSAWHMRAAAFIIVATAALVATATILRRAGIGGTWLGFAGDTPVTRELQIIMNRSLGTIDLESRVAGPVADPNFWSQCLVLALPLSLWTAQRRSGLASRTLAIAAIVAIVAGILYTQSRGGAIAGVLAVSIWMWFQGGRWRRALVLVPVVVAVAFSTTGAAERFSQLKDLTNPAQAEDGSIRGRLSENIAAWQMWRDHPVLGVGADQYPANYRRYAQRIGLDSRTERFAHNSYLQMGAESGTLGLLAFVGMLVTGAVVALRSRARLAAAGLFRESRLVEAILAGGVGFSFAAIFLHQAWPDYLWLVLGLIGGAWLMAARARTDTEATS